MKIPFLSAKNEAPASEPEVVASETEVVETKISEVEPEITPDEPEVSVAETEIAPETAEITLDEADDLLLESELSLDDEPAPVMQPRGADELALLHENARFLQDLATRIWRAHKQLDKALQKSDEPNLERFARRFEEIGETLSDYGIEIIDHTGQNYDVGLTLTVLQFEPTPGIARETICETIKPSLRVHGVLIPGEVVVAAPMAGVEEIA